METQDQIRNDNINGHGKDIESQIKNKSELKKPEKVTKSRIQEVFMIMSIVIMIAMEVSESVFAKDLLSNNVKQPGLQSLKKVIPQWILIIGLIVVTTVTFFRKFSHVQSLKTPLFLMCVHFPLLSHFFLQTQYSQLHYSLTLILSYSQTILTQNNK